MVLIAVSAFHAVSTMGFQHPKISCWRLAAQVQGASLG
jgi:hypothetical protein